MYFFLASVFFGQKICNGCSLNYITAITYKLIHRYVNPWACSSSLELTAGSKFGPILEVGYKRSHPLKELPRLSKLGRCNIVVDNGGSLHEELMVIGSKVEFGRIDSINRAPEKLEKNRAQRQKQTRSPTVGSSSLKRRYRNGIFHKCFTPKVASQAPYQFE